MMNASFKAFQIAAVIVLILVLGQIPVQGKSISDHVGGILKGPFVQTKLAWVSGRIDFTNGFKPNEKSVGSEKQKASESNHHFKSDKSQTKDSGFISGILKKFN